MDGTFKITLVYLKELGACRDGQRAFQKAFPNGGEYQDVLDRCAEEGRLDFGDWLLEQIGPTDEVRIYDDAVDTPEKGVIFAGRIEFKLSVAAKFIRAGLGIEAGWGIKAGWGIETGEGIEAGDDFCVFAGLAIPKTKWRTLAVVTAKTKPEHLMSGFWRPLDVCDEKAVL